MPPIMKMYATVNAENVVVAVARTAPTPAEGQTVVEVTPPDRAMPGWKYNAAGTPRKFTPPPAPPRPKTYTPLQWKLRFTQEERIAMRAAAAQSPQLADFLDLLNSAQDVVNTNPLVKQGLDGFVAAGALTADRVAQILA